MQQLKESADRRELQPLPDDISTIQPGGGWGCRLELGWGRLRRWYLKRFRKSYLQRIKALCRSPADCQKSGQDHTSAGDIAHEILDPRDLKYIRNQTDCHWLEEDDPFYWREKIPFARWGLVELQVVGYPLLALTVGLSLTGWELLAVGPAILFALVVYFFRDPPRRIPQDTGSWVSPADGKISEVTDLAHDDFIGGPAVRIGIFLSIFNVHINRAPTRSRVIALRYQPGKFLNALDPASAIQNECMWMALEEESAPHRPYVVRQIVGAIAKRIVCDTKPGEVLEKGHKFGMIKFGSRTELIVPKTSELVVEAKEGQIIKAGTTVLCRYRPTGNLALERP